MSGEVTKTTFELISGPFQWDRNEIVTIVGTDPDGDRVMARDRRGNQQTIPKTFLNPLPSAVRPLSVSQPPAEDLRSIRMCLCSGPSHTLCFHQSRGRNPEREVESREAQPLNAAPHSRDPNNVAAGPRVPERHRGERPGRPASGLPPPEPPGQGERGRGRRLQLSMLKMFLFGTVQDQDSGGDAAPPSPRQQLPGV